MSDNTMSGDDRDEFFDGYVEALLWANTYDETGELVTDGVDHLDNVTPEARARMLEECEAFLDTIVNDDTGETVADIIARTDRYTHSPHAAGFAGHDFALTRNRHGAGFWDRGLGADGDVLTDAAKSFGEANLCQHDDLSITHD